MDRHQIGIFVNSDLKLSMTIPFQWEVVTEETIKKMLEQSAVADEKNNPLEQKRNKMLTAGVQFGVNLIFCDYDQMKQVLVNIVLNSVDAMQESLVKTIKIFTRYDEENVYFGIEDTGTGMTEEQKRRIFDPFYTTKQKGNGLGLVEVQKIIQAHMGKIAVRSMINRGSTFTITLPLMR